MVLKAAGFVTLLQLIALGLQLLPVLTIPATTKFKLSSINGYNFGLFGYCNLSNIVCSNAKVGYDMAIIESLNDQYSLPILFRYRLSKLLIFHPISSGFTLVSIIFSIILQFDGDSVGLLNFLSIWLGFTVLLSLFTFLIDILLFNPHLNWTGWLSLAATIVLIICTIGICFMQRLTSQELENNSRYPFGGGGNNTINDNVIDGKFSEESGGSKEHLRNLRASIELFQQNSLKEEHCKFVKVKPTDDLLTITEVNTRPGSGIDNENNHHMSTLLPSIEESYPQRTQSLNSIQESMEFDDKALNSNNLYAQKITQPHVLPYPQISSKENSLLQISNPPYPDDGKYWELPSEKSTVDSKRLERINNMKRELELTNKKINKINNKALKSLNYDNLTDMDEETKIFSAADSDIGTSILSDIISHGEAFEIQLPRPNNNCQQNNLNKVSIVTSPNLKRKKAIKKVDEENESFNVSPVLPLNPHGNGMLSGSITPLSETSISKKILDSELTGISQINEPIIEFISKPVKASVNKPMRSYLNNGYGSDNSLNSLGRKSINSSVSYNSDRLSPPKKHRG